DHRRLLGEVGGEGPALQARAGRVEVCRPALLAAAAVAFEPAQVSLAVRVAHERSIGRASVSDPSGGLSCRLLPSRSPQRCGRFHAMPNIKQQEKRVRQSARQRTENLRWRSTAKTLMRRLDEAVADDDAKETEAR